MRTLALIPARSGSKGIPNKDFRPLCGTPPFARAVRVASEVCNWTCLVSDRLGLALANGWYSGMTLLEPDHLAEDSVPMREVVRWAARSLEALAYEAVVVVQPTQPLRTPQHVSRSIALLEDRWDSVVSVVRLPRSIFPDRLVAIRDGQLEMFLERQGSTHLNDAVRQLARPAWARDGTVYVVRRSVLESGSLYGTRCRPMEIPYGETLPLDEPEDWVRAEEILRRAAR